MKNRSSSHSTSRSFKLAIPLVTFALFAVALSTNFSLGHSQFYNLNNFPVPESREALILYRFFSYVYSDPPPLSVNKIPLGLTMSAPLTFTLYGFTRPTTAPGRKLDAESVAPLLGFNNTATGGRKLERELIDGAIPEPEVGSELNDTTALEREAMRFVHDINEPVTEIVLDHVFVSTKDGSANKVDSVQLTIMRYDDFRKAFLQEGPEKPKNFCCFQADLDAGVCEKLNQPIIPHDAQFFKSISVGDEKRLSNDIFGIKLTSSDMYILLLSNCGTFEADRAVLSGGAYLHNYFGYLPGIDAPKSTLYIMLAAFYVLLIIVFGIRAIRHRTQLIHIHLAIGVVLLMCLVDALMWFSFVKHRNLYPRQNNFFFSLAIITTVVRNIFAFMLVLVASLGWGITKAQLSTSTKRKIYLIVVSYVIFDSARQIMTQLRLSHELSFIVVLSCVLPVSILHGIIFFWIFSSLTEVIEELKSKRQEIKLALFLRFWIVLVFTIIGAAAFLCSEVYMMSQDKANNWKNDWIFTDLAPHTVFILVLTTMMVLWAPSRNSKAMAYSTELPDEETSGTSIRNVLGRESVDLEPSPTKDAMSRLTDDTERAEHATLEMTSDVADTQQNFKLWGKAHQPLQDLDYDDEES